MSLRQPSSTRTDTLCPYTTLWRSRRVGDHAARGRRAAAHIDRRLTADAFARVARVARYPAEEAVEPPSAAAGAERARANDAGLDDGRTVDEIGKHTSELQSLMRSSYAVSCLNKKKNTLKTLLKR